MRRLRCAALVEALAWALAWSLAFALAPSRVALRAFDRSKVALPSPSRGARMTARSAAMLGIILFILLLSFGSYLLDVPMATVIIAAVFAISVVLWVGRDRGPRRPR
jgi:hypothetical protein